MHVILASAIDRALIILFYYGWVHWHKLKRLSLMPTEETGIGFWRFYEQSKAYSWRAHFVPALSIDLESWDLPCGLPLPLGCSESRVEWFPQLSLALHCLRLWLLRVSRDRLLRSLHISLPRSCCATASVKALKWGPHRRTPRRGRERRWEIWVLWYGPPGWGHGSP